MAFHNILVKDRAPQQNIWTKIKLKNLSLIFQEIMRQFSVNLTSLSNGFNLSKLDLKKVKCGHFNRGNSLS